jgi:hypothetical protein
MPTLKELRLVAKELKLKGYSTLIKPLLIIAIEQEKDKPPPPPLKSPIPPQGKTRILSIDIGKKNFAFCIEEFDKNELLRIKNIPLIHRYNKDGTPTREFFEILTQIYINGEVILHINTDLTENCVQGKYLDKETFYNMNDLLDGYAEYFDYCDVVVVEQQMDFGKKKRNPMAVKLGQHCQSYFMFKYGRFKPVIEFPAYHKTQVLGAQKLESKTKKGNITYKAIDKPSRKKWSVQKAKEILGMRGEDYVLECLSTVSKKDDLADVLCQSTAFRYLAYVNKSINLL